MTRQRRKHRNTVPLQVAALTTLILGGAWAALSLGYCLGTHAGAVEPGTIITQDLPTLPRGRDLYISAPRYALSDTERDLVERVVMAESGNQTLEGQMAVAQCILNTAEATGQRPDAVVLAPNQYADPAARESVTESIREAVHRVFDDGETVTEEPIRYFYAPRYCAGRWHESALEYVITIGGHKFFKAPNT
jgi:hypothetical protein